MWDALREALGSLLAFFYAVVPNFGIGIILLTVLIRLVLYPLTAKQARSMAAMQRIQPEIKKIQQKYKNDRQKLNEELMAFYKEHQINPLAGCLPLLLQMPIFFALFQVLRDAKRFVPTGSQLFESFCPGAVTEAACDDPRGLDFLWMDLSEHATGVNGIIDALPYWILIAAVVLSGYLQSRQMSKLQRGRSTPQSQMMTRVFPVVFGVISISLPAGVVLYFLVSNLWQIGQQALVFGHDEAPAGKRDGKAPVKGHASESASKQGSKGSSDEVVEVNATSDDDLDEATSGNGDTSSSADAAPTPGAGARPNRSKSRKKKKRKRRR